MKRQEGRKRRGGHRQEELIRPVVLIKLGGVVFGVTVLNGDATRQDGGHVVAHHVPLLLLLLLLHPAQLEAWGETEGQEVSGLRIHPGLRKGEWPWAGGIWERRVKKKDPLGKEEARKKIKMEVGKMVALVPEGSRKGSCHLLLCQLSG